jgi:glycerophosphoryl diester phosphodiesterase
VRANHDVPTALGPPVTVDPRDYFTRRDPRIVAVAHRGGVHPGLADNSLAALERAADLGFRYVEIDVRATTDGRLVLWHGMGLERLRPRRLLDLDELRKRWSKPNASDPVDLEKVVRSLPDDMCYFLDLKNSAAAERLGETVRATRADSRFCIGSFSGRRTERAARIVEEATNAQPPRTITPSELVGLGLEAYVRLRDTVPDRRSAQIPIWAATRRLIDAAHNHDVVVIVWTVNRADDMHRLLDRGADGLMGDDLPLLKRVLQERGLWTW